MTDYMVNIGNIAPKPKIKLKNTIFIQMIGSQDMSYVFEWKNIQLSIIKN